MASLRLHEGGRRTPAVVGIADARLRDGMVPGPTTPLRLQAELAVAAAEDAGIGVDDIDAVLTAGSWSPTGPGAMPSLALSEYLGITPRFVDSTNIGGSSFEAHVGHAAMAIATGACDTALISYASLQRSERSRSLAGTGGGELMTQFEEPWGIPTPVGSYALAAMRHMHEYGTTSEQLAEVAVAARRWADANPHATMRGPLSVDDVLASPWISEPLHRLDCCLVTDGGGALILTAADDAPRGSRPVQVVGYGEAVSHLTIASMRDLTRTAVGPAGRAAFAMAGLTPDDVDVAELYDSFTITVLLELEDLGFCERGGAGEFVASGATLPSGALPTNTNGGGLSYAHPGMYGIFLLIEAVRQLRGEAVGIQVPDARTAIASGVGGRLSSAACVLLHRSEEA